jgi:hypothetical protein
LIAITKLDWIMNEQERASRICQAKHGIS